MINKVNHNLLFKFLLFFLLLSESCEKEDELDNLSNQILFSEFYIYPQYTTAKIESEITGTYGENIVQYGHCWSLESNPDTSDYYSVFTKNTFDSFVSWPENLEHNTTYYIRAYYKIGNKIRYSSETSFKTLFKRAPYIETEIGPYIKCKSAKAGGKSILNYDSEIIAKGICWNKTGDPDFTDNIEIAELSSSDFECAINNLEINTKYYVRAFATNGIGTGIGKVIEFTTDDGAPYFLILDVIAQSSSSIYVDVRLASSGELEVHEMGICWNDIGNPTVGDEVITHPPMDSEPGNYSEVIENLNGSTKYYIRAYIKNEAGIFYTEEDSITTLEEIP